MDELLKSQLFDSVVNRKPIKFDGEHGEFTLGMSTYKADTPVPISKLDDEVCKDSSSGLSTMHVLGLFGLQAKAWNVMWPANAEGANAST